MPLIVIYNPVSGDRTAAKLTTDTIVPLLTTHNVTPDKVAATEYAGHAGELLLSYIDSLAPSDSSTESITAITLVLVSGDGTLHEIVNALHSARSKREGSFPSLRIALIPGGTANALHSTFFPPSTSSSTTEPTLRVLASLLAFLSATPRLIPLTLAHTTISSSPPASASSDSDVDVVSAVVTSTALHAAILHDSEALRASVPGIERFKIAAEQNATTWYRGNLNLLPPMQQYDINTGAFIDLVREDEVGGLKGLVGPFVYFLSTVNVDRLEPLFRIAPLQRTLPPPPDAHTMDVLVVRPSLDRSLEGKSDEEKRERFKERVWSVLHAAYQDGAHIKAQYDSPDGKTKGMPVVEYFRVGGWQWIPEEDDEKAHLLCVDGKIFHTPKGGNVLAWTARGLDISVYA
ncbi:ATP-NAD kinase-like domain-containing protein [Russula emetica]|nr:ATP-NAD kinase-like domain-containing protein [Russula emetica]